MNELSLHIERLLLTHDCVVVPQFGGFVTMSISATRDDSEQCFFPPLRVVRFNPGILEDDGLLLSDVRASLCCSDVEAKRHIQRLVLDLRQQLLADGQADFGSIGLFQQDEDGRVSFSPCQAGVVTPVLFALDAFDMPKLSVAQRNDSGRGSHRRHMEQAMLAESQNIIIRINKRNLKNVVAAAAIMILCALFSSPVDDSATSNQATLVPKDPVAEMQQPKVQQQPKPEVKAQPVAQTSGQAAEETAIQAEAPAAPAAQQVALHEQPTENPVSAEETYMNKPDGKYCIVLASDVSIRNAKSYVKTLQKRGLTNARIYNNGKMNRVIIDGYQTENEAYNKNVELHRSNSEYATTWVMAL